MKTTRFKSSLADKFDDFVRLRKTSGRDYESQAYLLARFDRFLVDENFRQGPITRAITERYQQSLTGLSQRSQYNRFCVVRQMCEYLALDDPEHFIPPPIRHVDSAHAHVPYIYELNQIKSLLEAAGALPGKDLLFSETIRTVLGLLYTTGVRTGEALGFDLQHFDLAQDALFVAEGKFRKARWIPLSATTSQALRAYLECRSLRQAKPDSALFINRSGHRLTHAHLYRVFRRLLEACGITHRPGFGPRLHDFRHTFAVHRLLEWYRQGVDINTKLPALATYMGHANLSGTRVYLQATPQLIEQVDERYRNHFLNHVLNKGELS